jgi:predicted CoA-substrate-specific enzyme activase
MATADPLLLGIDLGTASVKLIVGGPEGQVIHRTWLPGKSNPLASLLQVLGSLEEHLPPSSLVKIGLTGSGRSLLAGVDSVLAVNEVVATALAVRSVYTEARSIIDLGGQFSRWILLGQGNQSASVIDFASNGLCAAGSGAFLEEQASRLGMTVESLGQMAARAKRGATIAGRCSVFAKSDMIHLQQKGTPVDEIALGLCQAMVRTFCSTVISGRSMEAPVVLVGGGATNPGLVRAFLEVLGLRPDQLIVPSHPLFLGAWGAARMASQVPAISIERFRAAIQGTLENVSRGSGSQQAILAPLSAGPGGNEVQPDEDPAPVTRDVAAYLGVDVGSVSTDLALLSSDFKLLQGIYLPTRGRPIEALNEGLSRIQERFGERLHILGVGSTGSGRHLAAKVLGADVTHNEITAQMVSSLFFVPEADTIFEIGGQDSKYIFTRDGRLADFEMNKICSGGTGSFLEEQAERLGIRIVEEFSSLALRAPAPCDLGTRCTVFMASELVRAQERGASLENICAGLAYAVARNYLDKVVAGRPLGSCILLQGGTASNRAMVAAFRQLLGRPVKVHPYNRISGAIGAALLAARAGSGSSRFLGFHSCAEADLRSFECRACANRCQVNQVHLGKRIVHFGDICERFSQRDRETPEVSRPFPELFAARDALLESYLSPNGDPAAHKPRLGLLSTSLNLEFLPLWVRFLTELGYEPVLAGRTTSAGVQEYARGVPAEVCLPIKAAVAQAKALLAQGEVDRIFLPGVLECPGRTRNEPSHTCFFVQQLPDMLRSELKERLVTAQFALGDQLLDVIEPVLALAEALHRPLDAVLRALTRAKAVYTDFAAARKRLGEAALRGSFDRAVVVLGRPYNVHDPFLNLSLARHLERLGLPAIPWDLLPLDEIELDKRWDTVPWFYNREQLRALEVIRQDPRLFPILVSSYGCGPDAFTVKHLEELLAGRPRLLLEFDEHRGEAGLVTRLEALADEIEAYLRRKPSNVSTAVVTLGPRSLPSGRRFFLPNFSEHARVYAAVLRSEGRTAVVLPEPDERTLRLGEQHTSGRECHPYSILAGQLIRFLQDSSPRNGDVVLLPICPTPCLLRQYGDAFRILLQRQGLTDRVEVWDATLEQLEKLLGLPPMLRLYKGLLATDVLSILATRLRPYEQNPGATNRIFAESMNHLIDAVAGRKRIDSVLPETVAAMMALPRSAMPGTRPVVGVTGDIYTRINPTGNAGLFQRLEQMGCEVWPSPFFAELADLSATRQVRRSVERGRLKIAAWEEMSLRLTQRARRKLLAGLPADVAALVVEPSANELIQMAQPYVGPRTNFLIVLGAAKMVDFLRRGASGVINAVGINCIVGTATASVIPAIRSDFGQAPIITLTYGNSESPAQRLRLETFVHQLKTFRRNHAPSKPCRVALKAPT